jgi:hypothetical protein
MQREKKQDRTIHCKYEPREPGDYQVEVRFWLITFDFK